MNVSKLMSKKLISVDRFDSVEQAVALLRQRGVRHLLVIHKSQLVGIISDRDLKRTLDPSTTKKRLMAIGGLYFLLEPILVEEIMTASPMSVSPTTSAGEAARIMLQKRFGALPVVRGDKVVGIVTETDLLKYFATLDDEQTAAKKAKLKRAVKKAAAKKRAPKKKTVKKKSVKKKISRKKKSARRKS